MPKVYGHLVRYFFDVTQSAPRDLKGLHRGGKLCAPEFYCDQG